MRTNILETVITICLSGRILEGVLEAIDESGLDKETLDEIESKLWEFVCEVKNGRTYEWWESYSGLAAKLYEVVPDSCGQLIEYTKQIQEITRSYEGGGMP